MFFPEKIKSIKPKDKVLEVGPGGSPYPRADVLLEKRFKDEKEAFFQRGCVESIKLDKKLVYYEGGRFPFEDYEFDYVICSHVLEHIHYTELELFCNELKRVAKKGYIEFPTLYYDYIYNFDVHVNLMNLDKSNTILFLPKDKTCLETFRPVHDFFYKTLQQGYSDLIDQLKEYFFVGFEWQGDFRIKRVNQLEELIQNTIFENLYLPRKSIRVTFQERLKNKLKKLINIMEKRW